MTKNKISAIKKRIVRFLRKNRPTIQTAASVAGMTIAVGSGIKTTINVTREIDAENAKRDIEMTKKEVVCRVWKHYVPTAVTLASSALLTINANAIYNKRNKILATACGISEAALSEYKSKVVDTIGEKKELSIRDQIAKDRLASVPFAEDSVICTGLGDVLCFDCMLGRYFYCDIDVIKNVEREWNKKIYSEMFISINQFFGDLNLPMASLGYDIGWNLDDGPVSIHYSSQLTDDGKPCLTIDGCVKVRSDYR